MTKQQKIWIAVGAGAMAVAVFCCAGLIAVFAWWMRPSPEDVVDDYLKAVRDKDSATAEQLSCRAWPTGVLDRISGAFEVVDWEITGSEVHDESADVDARVTYRVLGFAQSGRMVFTVVKEDDDWRVCGMRGQQAG
jgi:hypothetical protein